MLELGALDGSPDTKSISYDFEQYFGWKRIVIDGNPMYRDGMRHYSSSAFAVIAPICEHHTVVHYSVSKEYIGGILEFMTESFIKKHHPAVYEAGYHGICEDSAHGHAVNNSHSIQWKKIPKLYTVECMPLRHVLHKAKTKHINFFILNTQVNR